MLAEIPATGRSLVQRSSTDCGVSGRDRESSTMTRPWPTRAVQPLKYINCYVPETTRVCSVYIVAAVLKLRFVAHVECFVLLR